MSNRERNRKGAALVELAVCLPVFFMIAMATVETCRMIYLRQSIKIAAYECARLGIVPKMTRSTLVDQCDLILQGRRIKGYSFSCEPFDPSTLKYGDLFKTTIRVSADENDLLGTWFYRDRIFVESVSIMAEY